MPKAHVTVHPTGQAIATTGGHSLARRSRLRKTNPHCSTPTATPVTRPVMSRAPIPAPAKAPPSAPDTAPSTEPTSTKAKYPPSGKPRKASIHHRKKRHPPVRRTSLSVTTHGAAVPCVAISLPPKPRRASPCVSRVAGPSLEGGQVAVLHLHVASARSRNEGIILPSYGSECALWHQNTRRSTIEAPNFRELRKAEVRTIHIPGTWVNS